LESIRFKRNFITDTPKGNEPLNLFGVLWGPKRRESKILINDLGKEQIL